LLDLRDTVAHPQLTKQAVVSRSIHVCALTQTLRALLLNMAMISLPN
jgi:hypothetical protein